ncbi:MAG: hypothetical protein ACTHMF_10340 [Leifsonia sp.]|uniref:hypothetical protein n=1 Tax=Leifsonia sp. TaxID=1870902 RepID=UPI003F811508
MRNQDAGLIVGVFLGGCISFLVMGTLMSVGTGLTVSAMLLVALALGAVGFVSVLILGPRYLWRRKHETSDPQP